jgi:phage gp46-like protein
MKLNINSSSGNALASTISLPSSAFSGLNTDGILSITATQSTGQSLPSWISVNPSTGAVTVKAGAVVTKPLTVKVIIRDAQGKQTVVLVKVQAQKDTTESKPPAQKPKQGQQSNGEKDSSSTNNPSQQQGQPEQSDQSLAQVIKPGLTEQLKQTGSKGFELQRSKLLASVASLVAKDAA